MTDGEKVPVARRTWFLVAIIVAVGATLTWVAFGLSMRPKPPPDVTQGVELVPPTQRGGTGP